MKKRKESKKISKKTKISQKRKEGWLQTGPSSLLKVWVIL